MTDNNTSNNVTMPPASSSTQSSHTHSRRRPSWFVIQLTITASLGGCLFGYDLGAISSTLSQLTITYNLNNSQKELIVSILYVGGTVGAAFGGLLCDKIGRKISIIVTDIIFIIGSIWLYYFASSYESIVFGRFIIGIGIAISGIADVSYLHECSPIQYRGSIVSVNEACISFGFLLSYISGFIFSSSSSNTNSNSNSNSHYENKEEWRIVFGLAGILAFIQLVGMLLLPESPEWLIENGRIDEAKKVLERINGPSTSNNGASKNGEGSGQVGGDGNDTNNNNNNNDGILSSSVLVIADLLEPNALIRRKSRSRSRRKNSTENNGILEINPINSPILRNDDYGTDSIIMIDSKGKIKVNNDSSSSSLFGSRESLFTTVTNDDDDDDDADYHINSNQSCTFSFRHKLESVVMTVSRYRRQVYIALYLAIVQQLCGQTNILNYAPLIFEEATNRDYNNNNNNNNNNNINNEQQQTNGNNNGNENEYYEYPQDNESTSNDWSMVIIGVVKFIVTVLVIWKIEYIGRRKLFIFGNLLIATGLLALIIAFGGSSSSSSSSISSSSSSTTASINNDDDVWNGNIADDDNDDYDDSSSSPSSIFSWSPLTNVKAFHLALPGVLLVVCGYSCSFGPLTWLLTSEIFPTDIRGRMLGASTIVSYMFGAISTQTFLFATSKFGPSFVFGIYCIITLCGIFFAYMAIPDTGEKTVEQIDDSLNQMQWWKYDAIILSQYDSSSSSTTPPPTLEMTSENFSTTTTNASTRNISSSSLEQHQHVLS